jgi:hypothetical protein
LLPTLTQVSPATLPSTEKLSTQGQNFTGIGERENFKGKRTNPSLSPLPLIPTGTHTRKGIEFLLSLSPKSQYQTMQLFDFGELIPLVVVGGLIICVPLFFGGLVVIGEREVGIVVKKFARSPDIPTRLSPLP